MTIRTLGLVWGGTMGQGIAITSASAGLDVLLGRVESGRGFFEYDEGGNPKAAAE